MRATVCSPCLLTSARLWPPCPSVQDKIYLGYMAAVHLGALLAPFTFRCGQLGHSLGAPCAARAAASGGVRHGCCPRPPISLHSTAPAHTLRLCPVLPCSPRSWSNFAMFMGMYFITGCFGITLSYHRQLTHRSFTTPKWLEYIFAYCGVMSVQGDPLEWVSQAAPAPLRCMLGCLGVRVVWRMQSPGPRIHPL